MSLSGFGVSAPGKLEEKTDTAGAPLTGCGGDPPPDPRYIARWAVDTERMAEAGAAGVTSAEVASVVEAALTDSRGWGRAGITFQQSTNPQAVFALVETLSGPSPGEPDGLTFYDDQPSTVQIKANPGVSMTHMINHESLHAFTDVNDGGDGIMADGSPGATYPDFPTDSDIADTRAWLGI